MDLNDVALFVQVVRAGSLAEAGRRLGMPPSTCSRRIQQLEHDLGVRLIQRSTRRLALTGAGQEFFERCAAQVDALAESARQMLDARGSVGGRVRVAAPADFFHWFPFERVARFLADYPKVALEFELSDAYVDLLDRNIDIAIRTGPIHEPMLVARQFGVRGRFQVNTARAQLNAALAGLGIALVPVFMAEPCLRDGRLQAVLPR